MGSCLLHRFLVNLLLEKFELAQLGYAPAKSARVEKAGRKSEYRYHAPPAQIFLSAEHDWRLCWSRVGRTSNGIQVSPRAPE
jgi:hypothetical protein